MYHPTVGRFMQADPIGYASGMNLYAYVGNDPLNLTDPSGLCLATDRNMGPNLCLDANEIPGGTVIGHLCSIVDCRMTEWYLGVISVGGPVPRNGEPSGGSGSGQGVGQRASPPPKEKRKKSIGQCAAEQLGLEDLIDVALVGAGQPIPGTKPFVTPGSSRGTSLAGMAANVIFGKAKLPTPLPTIVGGPGTGRGLAIAGTRSVARIAGRAVPVLGWGLLAYDAGSVVACALGGDD